LSLQLFFFLLQVIIIPISSGPHQTVKSCWCFIPWEGRKKFPGSFHSLEIEYLPKWQSLFQKYRQLKWMIGI